MTWFVLALVALLFWSGSDLFSKMGSKPDDRYSHWKLVIAVGLAMGIHAAWELLVNDVPFTAADMIQYLPVSALYIVAMILGYVGLRYIELSISSPVCNSSGAVACVLCAIFLKETLTGIQTVAVVLITLGIIGLGIVQRRADVIHTRVDRKYTRSFIALLFPVIYCVLDGLGTFADAVVLQTMNEDTANVAYELTFLAMAVFAFIYVVIIKKEKLTFKRDKFKGIAAISETIGQFAYIGAIAMEPIMAAPMISAYCVLSAFWSHLILKERLTWLHYIMVGLAVVGIVILGATSDV